MNELKVKITYEHPLKEYIITPLLVEYALKKDLLNTEFKIIKVERLKDESIS